MACAEPQTDMAGAEAERAGPRAQTADDVAAEGTASYFGVPDRVKGVSEAEEEGAEGAVLLAEGAAEGALRPAVDTLGRYACTGGDVRVLSALSLESILDQEWRPECLLEAHSAATCAEDGSSPAFASATQDNGGAVSWRAFRYELDPDDVLEKRPVKLNSAPAIISSFSTAALQLPASRRTTILQYGG